MKNVVHICFSPSTRGAIKHVIKKGVLEGKYVICLMDDLSNGPVKDIDSITTRIDWLKVVLSLEYYELLEEVKNDYDKFNKDIINIKGEDICIWYSDNGREMTGLLYALSLLQSNVENIYTINVSEKILNKGKAVYKFRSTTEVLPERFTWFLDIKKDLDPLDYSSLMDLWLYTKNTNSNLRIVKDKKLLSVAEDYFDEMILKYTKYSYTKCMIVVGEVISRMEEYVYEFFIFWRIRELAKNGTIKYRGDVSNMRDIEIKRC